MKYNAIKKLLKDTWKISCREVIAIVVQTALFLQIFTVEEIQEIKPDSVSFSSSKL